MISSSSFSSVTLSYCLVPTINWLTKKDQIKPFASIYLELVKKTRRTHAQAALKKKEYFHYWKPANAYNQSDLLQEKYVIVSSLNGRYGM